MGNQAILEELTELWVLYKERERFFNNARLNVESDILALCKDEIKTTGTTNLGEGLTVVTGYTEKWDQDILKKIKDSWSPECSFPFRTEYQIDRDALQKLPCEVAETLKGDALTLFPKKPSFTYKKPNICKESRT